MDTITDTASLTDTQLRDEMLHHAYVISTLLAQGLDTKAKDRLDTFRVLREETQRRRGRLSHPC